MTAEADTLQWPVYFHRDNEEVIHTGLVRLVLHGTNFRNQDAALTLRLFRRSVVVTLLAYCAVPNMHAQDLSVVIPSNHIRWDSIAT